MENLIFAVVIGLTVYLFVRRMKMLKEQKRRQAEEAANGGPPAEPATMPRLGTPGTITRDQMKLLRKNDFEPSRLWSREEAQLILDSVAYLRGVVKTTTGDADPPLEVQNSLLRLILTDDELREYMYDWGVNVSRDSAGEIVETDLAALPRDEAFAKVERAVLEKWEKS